MLNAEMIYTFRVMCMYGSRWSYFGTLGYFYASKPVAKFMFLSSKFNSLFPGLTPSTDSFYRSFPFHLLKQWSIFNSWQQCLCISVHTFVVINKAAALSLTSFEKVSGWRSDLLFSLLSFSAATLKGCWLVRCPRHCHWSRMGGAVHPARTRCNGEIIFI